jgi:hypothetical protein
MNSLNFIIVYVYNSIFMKTELYTYTIILNSKLRSKLGSKSRLTKSAYLLVIWGIQVGHTFK